ncbi:phage shock protein C (PspC) family protein [Pseudonocardia thermophila]|jgi:Putative stress-responsive transcriptional regulator|uniref:Phage shock protein C (PspC) family protein n=1 Tax=Pseudonocardia thermophila TaxID=1848 RepID=A0A1M6RSG5_PSETH|nr:PspC domain-containing protein [Pseudonocardia thermophila]SHK35360.1 phage shock protein C (PspC) family protein [Pseudonocardia thermophila]
MENLNQFRIRRSNTDKMLGGVCGGLAQSLGVDTALLRIAFVVLTVLGAGVAAVLYVAIWALAPVEDPKPAEPATSAETATDAPTPTTL